MTKPARNAHASVRQTRGKTLPRVLHLRSHDAQLRHTRPREAPDLARHQLPLGKRPLGLNEPDLTLRNNGLVRVDAKCKGMPHGTQLVGSTANGNLSRRVLHHLDRHTSLRGKRKQAVRHRRRPLQPRREHHLDLRMI